MTICLNMIVKNEASILGRALRSVAAKVDDYVIVDTGSTEWQVHRMTEVIQFHFGDRPGRFIGYPNADFAFDEARNFALANASGRCDYILLMDADHELVGNLPEAMSREFDCYAMREFSDGTTDIWNPRLIRDVPGWSYRGSTHEGLSHPAINTLAPLKYCECKHHQDGAYRLIKYSRDLVLLKRDLNELSQRYDRDQYARTLFYLGQTHADLGETDAAISYYQHRVNMEDHTEERWYAMLQLGILSKSVEILERCVQDRHDRAEPLYEVAKLYREQRNWAEALAAASLGTQIPYPQGVHGFVNAFVYEWGCQFERSVAYWMSGNPTYAIQITKELLERSSVLPDKLVTVLKSNLTLYEGKPATL